MIEISDSQIIASIQRAAFQAVFEAFNAETSNILKIGLDYKLILYRNELVYSVIVQKPNRNSKDFFDCEIVCEKYAPFGGENKIQRRFLNLIFAKDEFLKNCNENNGFGFLYLLNYIRRWLEIKEMFA